MTARLVVLAALAGAVSPAFAEAGRDPSPALRFSTIGDNVIIPCAGVRRALSPDFLGRLSASAHAPEQTAVASALVALSKACARK